MATEARQPVSKRHRWSPHAWRPDAHHTFRLCGWFRGFETLDHNLNRGEVYVVTRVWQYREIPNGRLFEALLVDGARHFKYPHIGFPSSMFRPLIEKKTDISIFTAMLDPSRIQKVPAPASP